MLISYYQDEVGPAKPRSRSLIVLMAVNGLVAFAMLFAWTLVSMFVVEPMAWATWMQINRGRSIEDIFDYPFVLLWAMPVAGICGAWFASKARMWSAAYLCVAVPLITLAMIFGWYYLAPVAWH